MQGFEELKDAHRSNDEGVVTTVDECSAESVRTIFSDAWPYSTYTVPVFFCGESVCCSADSQEGLRSSRDTLVGVEDNMRNATRKALEFEGATTTVGLSACCNGPNCMLYFEGQARKVDKGIHR